MWRVGLLVAIGLGLAVPTAQAAQLNRATCVERDSAQCSLDRERAGRSHKQSRAHTQPLGKSRNGGDPGKGYAQSRTIAPAAVKPAAETALKPAAARSFDPLAAGTEARAPVQNEANPWLQPILLVLAGTGILSLFVAKAAEL